jgi:hypothetical protein
MEEKKEELIIDNIDDLKNDVKMRGFNNHFDQEIETRIKAEETEFILKKAPMQVNNDQMDYGLHCRVDEANRKGYANDLEATLTNSATGEVRQYKFPGFLRVTAKEAYNLLKYGQDTAVYKKLFNKEGQQYESYLTMDKDGELKQLHQNYYKNKMFRLEEALDNLAVPVKEVETDKSRVVSSLKRGNVHASTIYHNGQEQPGFLTVNAITGDIDVRDKDMKVIKRQDQDLKKEKEITQTQTPGQGEDLKKKSGNEQKVKWSPRKTAGIKIK